MIKVLLRHNGVLNLFCLSFPKSEGQQPYYLSSSVHRTTRPVWLASVLLVPHFCGNVQEQISLGMKSIVIYLAEKMFTFFRISKIPKTIEEVPEEELSELMSPQSVANMSGLFDLKAFTRFRPLWSNAVGEVPAQLMEMRGSIGTWLVTRFQICSKSCPRVWLDSQSFVDLRNDIKIEADSRIGWIYTPNNQNTDIIIL